ncbi:hypothetical protein ACJJTC_007123 [Scirpophaga incertulas]
MEDAKPAESSSKSVIAKASRKRIISREAAAIKHELSVKCFKDKSNLNLPLATIESVFSKDVDTLVNTDSSVTSDVVDLTSTESYSNAGANCAPSEDIKSFLVSWSRKHNISHSALNDLLNELKRFHPSLPQDARTLLGTPRCINLVNCAGGSYIYFGLEAHLIEKVSKTTKNYPLMQRKMSNIKSNLLLSVTLLPGLPIHSSSTCSFWPILCILDQSLDQQPFIGALYFDISDVLGNEQKTALLKTEALIKHDTRKFTAIQPNPFTSQAITSSLLITA